MWGAGALSVPARQCPRRPLEGSERLSLPGPAGAWGEGRGAGQVPPSRRGGVRVGTEGGPHRVRTLSSGVEVGRKPRRARWT